MKRLNTEISIPFKKGKNKFQRLKPRFKANVIEFPFLHGGKNTVKNPTLFPQMKHKGKTAWIFGSGVSINELNDLKIPKNDVTFALNGGVVFFWKSGREIKYGGMLKKSDYLHHLNYWMAFDTRVFEKSRLPEWDYANIAMRHPSAIKLFPGYINCFKAPNVYRYHLHKRQRNDPVLTTKFDGRLFTGDSILIPALHYCLITGCNRIILNGCDLCSLISGKQWKRYCNKLLNMKWKGHHIPPIGRKITAPNGEKGKVTGMYQAQISETMSVIRFIQSKGVKVFRTSKRGMLDIPLWKY